MSTTSEAAYCIDRELEGHSVDSLEDEQIDVRRAFDGPVNGSEQAQGGRRRGHVGVVILG